MENSGKKIDLVYPELSYKIIGCSYDVFNQLGFGHAEKLYQKGLAISFKKANISFTEQVYMPLRFEGEVIGKLFFDFLMDDKIVVEIKKSNFYSKTNIDQVNEYLKTSKQQLALLINFTPNGVISKRILNIM